MSGSWTITKEMLHRWLKFNAAGLLGFALQLGTLQLLLQLGTRLAFAVGAAVECAIVHNFFWHERVTWQANFRNGALGRFLRFQCSNGAVSLVGSILLTKWLVMLKLPPIAANAIAVVLCSIANFLLAEYFVFGVKQSSPADASDAPQGEHLFV